MPIECVFFFSGRVHTHTECGVQEKEDRNKREKNQTKPKPTNKQTNKQQTNLNLLCASVVVALQ